MKQHAFLTPSKHMPVSKIIFDRMIEIVNFSSKDIVNAVISSRTFLPSDEENKVVFFTKVHMGNLVRTYGFGAVNESLSLMRMRLIRDEDAVRVGA